MNGCMDAWMHGWMEKGGNKASFHAPAGWRLMGIFFLVHSFIHPPSSHSFSREPMQCKAIQSNPILLISSIPFQF